MNYLTDAIYRASRPDAVRALYAISVLDQAARQNLAVSLTSQGYKINTPMDIWGWDAGKFMAYATQLGAKTIPAMNEAAPGTIPVSINADDYPPADPAPAPPAPPTSPIGAESTTPGTYGVTQAAFNGHGVPIYAEAQSIPGPKGEPVFFNGFLEAFFGVPAWRWETAQARATRIAAEGGR